MGPQVPRDAMELPIRSETKGICNEAFDLRCRLLLGVSYHQDILPPLARRGAWIDFAGGPQHELVVGDLHTAYPPLDLLLAIVNQLQGWRIYKASDQTCLN